MTDLAPSTYYELFRLTEYNEAAMYIKALHVAHWLSKQTLFEWAKFHDYHLTEQQILDTCGKPGD